MKINNMKDLFNENLHLSIFIVIKNETSLNMYNLIMKFHVFLSLK